MPSAMSRTVGDTGMIDSNDNVIDSREIIERMEELNEELESIEEVCDEDDDMQYEDQPGYLGKVEELHELRNVRFQCSGISDWEHGATLINELYFTDYIREMINDCYSDIRKLESGEWPMNHIEMDWEGAADEAHQDYTAVEFEGNTFLVR